MDFQLSLTQKLLLEKTKREIANLSEAEAKEYLIDVIAQNMAKDNQLKQYLKNK